MTTRLLILIIATIGVAPVVLRALASVVIAAIPVVFRPVSLSFRLFADNATTSLFQFPELSLFTSACILAGAGLLFTGILSPSRY